MLNKKQLAKPLFRAAEKAEVLGLANFEGAAYGAPLALISEEGALVFHDEAWRALNEVIGLLLKEKSVGDLYSRKTVEQRVHEQVEKLCSNPPITLQDAEAAAQELLDGFQKQFPEATYYIPIVNLKLEVPSLQIGRVTFRPLTEDTWHEMKSKVENVINKGTLPDNQRSSILQHMEEGFSPYIGYSVAEVVLSVEPNKGTELASEGLSAALDVLRFYSSFFYTHGERAWIGQVGEVQRGWRAGLVLFGDGAVRLPFETVGFRATYTIDTDRQTRLREMAFDFVSQALGKDVEKLTELENKILRAIRWFASGRYDSSEDSSFVKYIIALETLLTDGNEAIGTTIAERAAFLLHDEAEMRRSIFKDVKRAYSVRNGLVHRGNASEVASQIRQIEQYAWYAVVSLSQLCGEENLKKVDDLRKWMEDRKFGK